MRERLVRIRHTVNVVFLLHRSAASVCRVEKLADEPVCHRLFAASASIGNDPADRERVAPFRVTSSGT